MTTSKQRTARDTAIIAVSSLLFVHLLFWLIPGVFKTWNFQTTDQLFRIRASVPMWQIPYDSTIVHVDEKDTTTEKLHVAYLARHHYARVVQALGDTKAAAQIYDYIFRAPTLASEDSLLFEANRSAHNAYYGIAFSLVEEPPQQRPPRPPMHWAYLDSTSWRVTVAGDISHMLFATNPILTFPELAQCARGLGYLSLQYDEDGVFRRAPLLVRLDDKFYPSF
ncbi:MAG: CHASE2 domain-containing protein, partial [Ignavibacteriales bacterium]|nr:CHASE2 domain-containing protein [Ignavibacteriales bacterium]